MGKKITADVMDPSLMKIGTATTLRYTSSEPADRAAAVTATLIAHTLTPGTIAVAGGKTLTYTPGSLTIGAGTGNNRRITLGAQTGMTATAGAPTNATHACLDDGTTLLAVTTVTSFSVTNGGSYNGNALYWEVNSVPTP